MYIVGKNNNLLEIVGGSTKIVSGNVTNLINTRDKCVYTTPDGIYKNNKKIANPGRIYTLVDGRVVFDIQGDISLRFPYSQLYIFARVIGDLVYFSESFCVYKNQNHYIAKWLDKENILFPAKPLNRPTFEGVYKK